MCPDVWSEAPRALLGGASRSLLDYHLMGSRFNTDEANARLFFHISEFLFYVKDRLMILVLLGHDGDSQTLSKYIKFSLHEFATSKRVTRTNVAVN